MTPRQPHSALPDSGELPLLGAVLDIVPTLVVLLDSQGRILRFNRACEDATGRPEAEVLGTPIWEVLVAADEDTSLEAVFRSLRVGRFPSSFRQEWVASSGEQRRIDWSIGALLDEAGAVALVIGSGVDSTRRRSAVEAARADGPRVPGGGVVAVAVDGIISVDGEQNIILFNEGAAEIFGWPADEVVGQPLDMLLPERFRAEHRMVHVPEFAASPFAARRMGERGVVQGLRRSGVEFPAEATISKITVGEDLILTVLLRDISPRLRLEAAQRLLVQAGEVLATSLDVSTILGELARLCVGSLAELCIVDLVGTGGVERLEVAHRDPARAELADRLRAIPLDHDRPHLAFEALASRRAVLAREVTPEGIAELSQCAEQRELLEALGLVSYLAVPLIARSRLLGVIVLASSSRAYGEDDLALAKELACGRRWPSTMRCSTSRRSGRSSTATSS